MVATMTCRHCERVFEGRRRPFCTSRCRSRASRRRKAGLEVDCYNGPQGARRGQVRLGDVTRAELDVRRALLRMRWQA